MINLQINFDYTGIFYQGLLLLSAPQCGSVKVNFLVKYPLDFFDIGDGKMCPCFCGLDPSQFLPVVFPQIICKSERNEAFLFYINFPQKILQNFASKLQTCKIQLPTYEIFC